MPQIGEMTEILLFGKDVSRPSNERYELDRPAHVGAPYVEWIRRVTVFLRRLKAESDLYYYRLPQRATNYEDLYYLASPKKARARSLSSGTGPKGCVISDAY